MMETLSVEFAGHVFKNPLLIASGTCGFGREYGKIFDLSQLGGICSKGLTLHPRPGNDGIRIWETPSGIMNSVGLENPGVEKFIREEWPFMKSLDTKKIINLGGHSIEDYEEGISLLNGIDADIIELNISCPNVKSGGMNFGVKTGTARDVVKRVRKLCRHTLVIKLSPNAENIVELARACEEEGAEGLSLVNTFLAMAVDTKKRKPVFDNTYAGLSGPAIKPIALRMIHQVSRAVKIPLMGIGGISSWQDALEFIMAGARLFQTGTANFSNPVVSLEIIQGLEHWMRQEKAASIIDICGII